MDLRIEIVANNEKHRCADTLCTAVLSLLLQRAFHQQIRRIAVREFLAHQRKAVLFPERFTLRIAPIHRKAHLVEPLPPQLVQQLADQRRAKAAALPLLFRS